MGAVSPRDIRLSIVVPACNNPGDLRQCLSALVASAPINAEIIVVDDGSSTDENQRLAERMGVRVFALPRNAGPSSARNHGVRQANGDIIFFVDSDVVIAPGAVRRVMEVFEQKPHVAAVFGSYDDHPTAPGLVSQYRNLLHHYVHQHGETAASTFWGACGAIRRSAFEAMGGFDEKRFPRCIEDIELGYRLRNAGYQILLDKDLQGTHLKRWTLPSMVRTDVFCRAVPWTRLILESKRAPDDLNLRDRQRASVALVGLAGLFALAAPFSAWAIALSAIALLAVIALNWPLYRFFIRHRGLGFTAGAIPLHLLYFVYGGLTYLYVSMEFRLRRPTDISVDSPGGKRLTESVGRSQSPL